MEPRLEAANLVDVVLNLTTGDGSKLTSLIQSGDLSSAIQFATAAIAAVDAAAQSGTENQDDQTEKRIAVIFVEEAPFSSPEAALLLVSTKDRRPLARSNTGSPRFTDFPSLCACPESSMKIWLVQLSIYCVYKAIQNRNVVGRGQRSRFLVLTKRSAASGDENEEARHFVNCRER